VAATALSTEALAMPFDHDVFVSYARADDAMPFGSDAEFGLVTTLAANINRGIGIGKKQIFIDHNLMPGDAFNDDLKRKVERSAVLVVLLSENYIKSEWCGQELQHFIDSHGDDPRKPRDVFVVELAPFETLRPLPSTIETLDKELLRIKFWFQPIDQAVHSVAGDIRP
jgi:hypothetical protein